MTKQPYTEAKRRANAKWDEANKERKKYISKRSYARNFIKKLATPEDLAELRGLIEERENELK